MSHSITLTRPDDWHVHFRDGAQLNDLVPHHAVRFGRVVVMPNLLPPVTTPNAAIAYRERILATLPDASRFNPRMALYLTPQTTPEEVELAAATPDIHGYKLYPAGATTHSDAGVSNIMALLPTLQAMADCQLPLMVHAEVTDHQVDIFDREAVFLDSTIKPLLEKIPHLKLVIEHITTATLAHFITSAGDNVAATITPQHLLYNRNVMFKGGIRPHYYCLPVLKRETDRQALLALLLSSHPRLFLGSDSAPHSQRRKESGCGCAGIFSGHAAIELYATVFAEHKALDRLEPFASHFGADFYGLPRNHDQITLSATPWQVPESYPLEGERLIPLAAGETIAWQLSHPQPVKI
ncbi:MAG: dihydroorotase [Gammaproteobacteria bacterium]|nr:dihydroorotase [Gammaproteobacteria bacterium]